MSSNRNSQRLCMPVLAVLSLTLGLSAAMACDTGASPTATTMAGSEADSRLMERLAQMPDTFKEKGIWFGDMGRALEMAGVSQPDSVEEMRAMSDAERDAYRDALSGVVQTGFFARMSQQGWEEAFGVGSFDVGLAMHTGETSTQPAQMNYLEGDFDEAGIRQRLVDQGYEAKEASGETYYAIRDDYEWGGLFDPAGRMAMGSMNRVFVSDDTLIAAPATEMITGILAARAREMPSLAEDTAFSSLAKALGDPLSAVLLDRATVMGHEAGGVATEGVSNSLEEYHRPSEWDTIHQWEALGIGFGRDGDKQWWDIALFYPDSSAAEADADELVQRMQDYTTAATELAGRGAWIERPIDRSCSQLTTDVQKNDDGSTLGVHCPLTEDAVSWVMLVELGDLGFLLP